MCIRDRGYTIYATRSTADKLIENGIPAIKIKKISAGSPNALDLILAGEVDLVIDTPTQGRDKSRDGFLIRRNAIETGCTLSLIHIWWWSSGCRWCSMKDEKEAKKVGLGKNIAMKRKDIVKRWNCLYYKMNLRWG